MATTNFTSGTVIASDWLNDVDEKIYQGTIATGSTTRRTLENRAADVINVKDFGAVGDGVTDDTVAIQAALTAATGKGLYFPPASYKISAELNVSANTYVFAKNSTAVLTQVTSGQNAFTLLGNNISIDGLHIVGPNVGSGSAIRGDSRTNPIICNCVIQSWLYGVQLRGCKNAQVEDNRFYGGTYDSGSSSDIFIYGSSGSPSNRVIISRNFCLSNNDNGISVDTNSGDREVIISNNLIYPLDTDGVTALADANNRKRYGIVVGYNGGTSTRAVVSGNLLRDIPYSGIYIQAATMPSGDVSVIGNVVTHCGFGTLYPTDASLRAGIFMVGGGGDVISGNVVVDCETSGIKIAPDFIYSSTNQPRATVSGNTVARTTGKGIFLTNKPHGYLVANNRVINSTDYNIYFETTTSDGGNCSFIGNHIDSNTTNKGGIIVANISGGYPCFVQGNTISGSDNTTNDEFNSGVWFNGEVHVTGNLINKFHRGINCATTLSARTIDLKCSSNTIKNCVYGIYSPGDGPWLVDNNTFKSVTTSTFGAAYQGILFQSGTLNVIHTVGNAAPTTGTWAQGDHVVRQTQAAGAAKGWFCTVAGTSGTWVSEGNL